MVALLAGFTGQFCHISWCYCVCTCVCMCVCVLVCAVCACVYVRTCTCTPPPSVLTCDPLSTQVQGSGTPNPYRLYPLTGSKIPVNGTYAPIITMYNPHPTPLQVCMCTCVHQCCGHYRGIAINYHCNYLGIKALRLPLPLRISTKVINYHCNYISTIAITIINYRFILGCLPRLLHPAKMSYVVI